MRFEELSIGNIFRYNDNIYMRIEDVCPYDNASIKHNAVIISHMIPSMIGYVTTIEDNDSVHYINNVYKGLL